METMKGVLVTTFVRIFLERLTRDVVITMDLTTSLMIDSNILVQTIVVVTRMSIVTLEMAFVRIKLTGVARMTLAAL